MTRAHSYSKLSYTSVPDIEAGADDHAMGISDEWDGSDSDLKSPATSDHSNSVTELVNPAGWKDCSKAVWEHDKKMIENWNTEIDAFLIFDGLLAAILTAFIVPYYVLLQPQANDASLVAKIRLFDSTSQGNAGNTTVPAYIVELGSSTNITPEEATIITNTCWLSAFVCTLAMASIGIYVKQWLHRYQTSVPANARPSVRVWSHRRRNLDAWWVANIISVLPILLQIALALFLVGLVVQLWSMNALVAVIVSVQIGALLLFTVVTAIMPAFVHGCPYKSPLAWFFVYVVSHTKRMVRTILRAHRKRPEIPVTWTDFERLSAEDAAPPQDPHLMAHPDSVLKADDYMDKAVRPFIENSPLVDACHTLELIIQGRAERRAFDKLYRDQGKPLQLTIIATLILDAIMRVGTDSTSPTASVARANLDTPEVMLPRIVTRLAEQEPHPGLFMRSLKILSGKTSSRKALTQQSRWLLSSILADGIAHYAGILSYSDLEGFIRCIPKALRPEDILSLVWTTTMVLCSSYMLSANDASKIRSVLHTAMISRQAQFDDIDAAKTSVTTSSRNVMDIFGTSSSDNTVGEMTPPVSAIDIMRRCIRIARKQVDRCTWSGFERSALKHWDELPEGIDARNADRYDPRTVEDSIVLLFIPKEYGWRLWRVLTMENVKVIA